jgi:hypothetical protein
MQNWHMITAETTTETLKRDLESALTSPREENLGERAVDQYKFAKAALAGLAKSGAVGAGPIYAYASGAAAEDPDHPPVGQHDFIAINISRRDP